LFGVPCRQLRPGIDAVRPHVQNRRLYSAGGQNGPAAPDFAANNNFALDQVSLFLSGRATNYAGGFIQATYDGVAHGFFLDNTDLRLTTPVTLWQQNVQLGLSANNGPMVQDPFNTTYAWNFPFFSSSLAPTPAASTILGGPLLGNTLGLTAYTWVDQSLYAEAGFYDTEAPGFMSHLGEAYGPGSATAPAPYVRLAYELDWDDSSAHVGAAFFRGRFNPATDTFSSTGALGHDTYTDGYLDAGYQYLTGDGRHSVTLNGFYTHEDHALDGTQAAGGATTADGTLNETRLVGTYYFDRTYGATVAWGKLFGSADPALYQQGTPIGGSANGKPDSNDYVLEADWVPFGKGDSWLHPLANLKLGLQYTIYTEFNGAARNYDGFGRNAADNNTLFLFAWLIF
jgi:hypothetical protein